MIAQRAASPAALASALTVPSPGSGTKPRRLRRAARLGLALVVILAFVSPLYLTIVNAFKKNAAITSSPGSLPLHPTLGNLSAALNQPGHVLQLGLRKHPELPDVPLILDLAETSEQKKLLELQFTAFELGRPYFVAEGVPADRVTALRRAFDQVMKDKDLLADAAKQSLEINPAGGAEMQEIVARIYTTPKELVARLAEASKSQPDLKVR